MRSGGAAADLRLAAAGVALLGLARVAQDVNPEGPLDEGAGAAQRELEQVLGPPDGAAGLPRLARECGRSSRWWEVHEGGGGGGVVAVVADVVHQLRMCVDR